MRDPIRIALLSRNTIVREGLRRILSDEHFEVTQSVGHSSQLHEVTIQDGDDGSFLIVVDDGGPEEIAEVQILQSRFPAAHIVLLSDDFNFETMVQAFRLGVHGYIVKHISCEPLIGSLQLIAMGEKVMPSELADALEFQSPICHGGDNQRGFSTANLSEREVEILECLVMGYPNKIVSRRLGISEATVKVHVKAILRKLLVQNRTQAAIWAVNHGMESHSRLMPVENASLGERSSVDDPGHKIAA